jgi:hypothetical protein
MQGGKMSDQAKKCIRCDSYLAESELAFDLCVPCRQADEKLIGQEPLLLKPEFLDKLLDMIKNENKELSLFKDESYLLTSSVSERLKGALRLGQVLALLDVCDALTGVPVEMGKRLRDQILAFEGLGK